MKPRIGTNLALAKFWNHSFVGFVWSQQLIQYYQMIGSQRWPRVNRLKSKACEGFLFYLNHDELVLLLIFGTDWALDLC